MTKIDILSVNISEQKGTIKKPVDTIELDKTGVANDAHSGNWHRQVSLLAQESIDKFSEQAKREIAFGEFAENITTKGLILHKTAPLDRFTMGDMLLEVTQIGKKCHGDNCSIFREVGNCVMPKEGIFCRVLKGGELKAGDQLDYQPRIIKTLIITLSDRASRGEYVDKSGPLLKKLAEDFFKSKNRHYEIETLIIPDNEEQLKTILLRAQAENYDIVFTTGGTGIGPKDITPDVVKPLLTKEIPGIMELIRVKYGMEKANALMSRGIAGVMNKTLIYTLPGNPKAVNEYCNEIFKTIEHSLYMLNELDLHG
ncbi:MOSC domain-containing protein [Ancylomarina salipaludis]|uniref:MOSC domain-containing protein n=1 Tax=Ancylomarina salipaludis TaxID=2501299 RepID=A0A4Q1JNA4_9BACT|nr:MOSC domain-containing protein [Ancylomarina salipaludis]RXQ95540.1 MOSC domain-containing protein [Ancylomarina salipaludis]